MATSRIDPLFERSQALGIAFYDCDIIDAPAVGAENSIFIYALFQYTKKDPAQFCAFLIQCLAIILIVIQPPF